MARFATRSQSCQGASRRFSGETAGNLESNNALSAWTIQWMSFADLSYVSAAMVGDRQGSSRSRREARADEAIQRPKKIIHKTKRLERVERVERAIAIRAFALKLLGQYGRWQTLFHGPEVLRFENARFLIMFHIKQPVPMELRERFRIGPLGWGLYGLELWDKQIGKVLNIHWDTLGGVPSIVTFKRGEWEELLVL